MPYYNEDDKKFYLYFLYENANQHPIFLTRTEDYSSFEGFTQVLPAGPSGSQDEWIGTGSFIKKEDTYYCFYTGHNANLDPAEKIMLATSSDLVNWSKQPLATFQALDTYDKNNFRDPHVYWDENQNSYVMLITTRKSGKGALARYQSSDLNNWSIMEPLVATSSESPTQYEIETDSEILECPDIFKMGDKWYLTFSRINRDKHRKTYYRVSDSPDGPWKVFRDENGKHETFDGLYLYAGKTASDGSTRYLSGWASTGQTVNENNELPWSGNLISHKLVQDPSGKLYPAIPEAVDEKFKIDVPYEKIDSEGTVIEKAGEYTIESEGSKRSYALFNRNTTPVKVSMKIDASQSNRFGFSFGACEDMSEIYSVTFDLMAANHAQMPALFMYQENKYSTTKNELNFTLLIIPTNKKFDIKIVIENSICVVYVNNQVAFTNRIRKINQNPWTIFSDQGAIKVSAVKIEKS